MDFIGPLVATMHGNCFILTVTDLFSKWPVAYPLNDKEPVEISLCLVNLFTTFGFPESVLCNNSDEFCEKVFLFTSLCFISSGVPLGKKIKEKIAKK